MESLIIINKQQLAILKGISIIFFIGIVNGFYKNQLFEASRIIFWLQDIFVFIFLPISILYLFYSRLNFKPSQYGFIKPTPIYPLSEIVGSTIFTAVVLGSVYYVVNIIAYYFLNKYGYTSPEFKYSTTVPTGLLKLPVVFYFAGTAAIVEEIVYRGIPYKLIMENESIRHQKLFFVLATSTAFSLIHWESGIHELFSTFAFGIVAALFYLSYKNIWPLIGGHFLVNIYVFW